MPTGQAKLFECVTCGKRYSLDDVLERRYYPLTGVCRRCYLKMAKASPRIWCFGKNAHGKSPGYSEENEVCQHLCPDRIQCVQFINLKKEN